MFGRVILSVLALSTLAVVGCERAGHPDRDRLEEGAVASAFDTGTTVVKVEMRPGDDPLEMGYGFVDVGTQALVTEDKGSPSDPDRPVWVSLLDGKHKGMTVNVKRKYLRERR